MAAAIALLAVSACSSEDDANALDTTTSTTEAATTTLSEQAQAEADVAQLVTDFWLTEIDTSKGEMGQAYLTGLVETRNLEAIERFTAEGQILRDRPGLKRIEVLTVEVDVAAGTGEVKVCNVGAAELLDARPTSTPHD